MKRDYYKHLDEQENGWLTTYLDIIMLILTFFVFLTTFTVQDRDKVSKFRDHFRKSLILAGSGTRGAVSIADSARDAAVENLVNKVKKDGLSLQLTEKFLEISEMKDLQVRDGNEGIVITFPEALLFEAGTLNSKGREYLGRIASFLAAVPYFVELKGVCREGREDPLGYSVKMGLEVYSMLVSSGVSKAKLKVTGNGSSFSVEGQASTDRVEMNIREEF